MTWFGWLGLLAMFWFGFFGFVTRLNPKHADAASMFFGLAAFGFALLVWGAVAY